MRVLVGCERSGIVRDAFRRAGHDAWSCDLEPCEGDAQYHIQADILSYYKASEWHLLIIHPPCTYLSVSGFHWNYRRPERKVKTEQALHFARKCFRLCQDSKMACLENPVSIISTRLWTPDQIIQPHMFGHDASKATCLWLWGLPNLEATSIVPGRQVVRNGKTYCRWANQTDSGQNRLGPSKDRAMNRARTYTGIADAMAKQWGACGQD